ncbi:hypothetical protein BCR44DRAFT_1429488, partial [Catenaria anguillulae PL171]
TKTAIQMHAVLHKTPTYSRPANCTYRAMHYGCPTSVPRPSVQPGRPVASQRDRAQHAHCHMRHYRKRAAEQRAGKVHTSSSTATSFTASWDGFRKQRLCNQSLLLRTCPRPSVSRRAISRRAAGSHRFSRATRRVCTFPWPAGRTRRWLSPKCGGFGRRGPGSSCKRAGWPVVCKTLLRLWEKCTWRRASICRAPGQGLGTVSFLSSR